MGGVGTAPLIRNISARWRWIVVFVVRTRSRYRKSGSLREEKKSIASVGSVTLDRPTDSLANKEAVSVRLPKCLSRSGMNMHFYDHNNNSELLCQLPHEQLLPDNHYQFLNPYDMSKVLRACVVTPCSLVGRYKRFGVICCLRFQVRDIASYLPHYTQSHNVCI